MSEYTDEQVRQAVLGMPMNKRAEYVQDWEFNMFREFLDALPDQNNDWQACIFDDFRLTDLRVKVVYADGTSIEGPPKRIEAQQIELGTLYWINNVNPEYGPKFFRIPAPVVHPDPEEHPVILVHTFDGDQMPEGTYASITQNQAHGYVYELVPGDGTHPIRTRPDAIDEWEPAKVVPANYVGEYPTRNVAYKGVNR